MNPILLSHWLPLAGRAGVAAIGARFGPAVAIDDVRDFVGGGPARASLARAFRWLAEHHAPPATMWRWDCCAPESLKQAAADGADAPPALDVELDDPRFLRVLGELEARGEAGVAVAVRPWVAARREGGLPVEFRAFVEGGAVAVSNYHARRPLPERYLDAARAAQARARALAALCPLRSFSADFLVRDDGELAYLEGGVGAGERGLLDLCCFEAPPRADAVVLRRG